MFEPPTPPERLAAFPSFQPLFGANNPYLELLHLPSARPVFALVEEAVWRSPDADGEIAALLGERSWRCHLVAAAAILATGATPARVEALWRTLEAGSWVASQLAATAWLVTDDFEARARRLILDGSWPKTTTALGHFYRQLPSPKLQVVARLADPKLVNDVDARDGALYAGEWLGKLATVTTPAMQARWRRPPAPAAPNTRP